MFTNERISQIEPEAGIIVGPISAVLGYILNLLYNFAQLITPSNINSLVISIILLTIVARVIMLPMAFKQQLSMYSMKRLDPEKEKIQKKYKNKTDSESKQKMNMEIQKLYSENGVNPLSGCLPILIQMPIFIALSYIMRHIYLYIEALGELYTDIAEVFLSLPGFLEGRTNNYFISFNNNIVQPMLSREGLYVDLLSTEGISQVINKMSPEAWEQVINYVPTEYAEQFTHLLYQKAEMESFFGISIIGNSGFGWPGMLIPIIAGFATYLSSSIMMKQQPSNDNPSAAQMQKMMIYFMPVMMVFMTATLPVGVGIYWITSSIFQIFQQYGINKYQQTPEYTKKMEEKCLAKAEAKKLKKQSSNKVIKK
jgi:YidC/Oxa1 family membrane protein insertase